MNFPFSHLCLRHKKRKEVERRKVWTKLRLKTKWDFSIKVSIKFFASRLWERRMSGGGRRSSQRMHDNQKWKTRSRVNKKAITGNSWQSVACAALFLRGSLQENLIIDLTTAGAIEKQVLFLGFGENKLFQEAFTLNLRFWMFFVFRYFFFGNTRSTKQAAFRRSSQLAAAWFRWKFPTRFSSCKPRKSTFRTNLPRVDAKTHELVHAFCKKLAPG